MSLEITIKLFDPTPTYCVLYRKEEEEEATEIKFAQTTRHGGDRKTRRLQRIVLLLFSRGLDNRSGRRNDTIGRDCSVLFLSFAGKKTSAGGAAAGGIVSQPLFF